MTLESECKYITKQSSMAIKRLGGTSKQLQRLEKISKTRAKTYSNTEGEELFDALVELSNRNAVWMEALKAGFEDLDNICNKLLNDKISVDEAVLIANDTYHSIDSPYKK